MLYIKRQNDVRCLSLFNREFRRSPQTRYAPFWQIIRELETVQHKKYKMLSYRRETALQGALQFSPKVEDWNWETIFYRHYRSIFNHWYNRPENLSNSVRKRKNKGYYGVQGHRGRYQLKARMRLPFWHLISYHFGVITAYCSNFGHCVFEPPFGGLGTTYDVHLGLIGKRV